MTDPTPPANPPDPISLMRSRGFIGLLILAAIVGIVVSVAAWAFLELATHIRTWVYTDLPKDVGFDNGTPLWWSLPVLAIAGTIIAFAIVRLPGAGGHVPAYGLSTEPTEPIGVPGVVLAGLATVGLGVVLGPEAPLLAMGGGLGILSIRLLRRDAPSEVAQVLGAAGAFSALSLIFGNPLIAAVILIEAIGLGGPAMQPTANLDLSDTDRSCMCQGGGGFIDPQWVTVTPWNGPEDYKLLEGYVVKAWSSTKDAPFNHTVAFSGGDWYVIHDIDLEISPDPRYFELVSSKPEFESNPHLLGCEAENYTIPERFRPVEGDRVSMWGFWILDCGHDPFYTEIHPIVGWAVHRNRPVRIPDDRVFTFDLGTNTVNSTAGTNLYAPGVITDIWFNTDTGAATGGNNTSLAQPANLAPPPLPPVCVGDNHITQSPIQREYDFNIYLPKNPSQVFAETRQARPRAPLYTNVSNPHASDGPQPDAHAHDRNQQRRHLRIPARPPRSARLPVQHLLAPHRSRLGVSEGGQLGPGAVARIAQ